MARALLSIDTHHEDLIHDAQFDYYSKKMATCSSDRTIKVFSVTGDTFHNTATIKSHEGPIWQVAWAHPKFGSLLASCSFDGTVKIHREGTQNSASEWAVAYEYKFRDASANSVSWAPHEHGLILACAASDGSVVVLEYKNDDWVSSMIRNDIYGCNAVSWAPFNAVGSAQEDGKCCKRLVTASCDHIVRMWRQCIDGSGAVTWIEEKKSVSSVHTDWVRDVAWAPTSGVSSNQIASCGEDRCVVIWKQTEKDGIWSPTIMKHFDAPVWRVSWSVAGNVLAVSTGDHNVTLWKQSVDESWVQITNVENSVDGM